MIKLFDKWDVEGITVEDKGLKEYINLDPKIVPLTGATYAGKRFHKSKTFIVERLMNKTIEVCREKGLSLSFKVCASPQGFL